MSNCWIRHQQVGEQGRDSRRVETRGRLIRRGLRPIKDAVRGSWEVDYHLLTETGFAEKGRQADIRPGVFMNQQNRQTSSQIMYLFCLRLDMEWVFR